MTGKIAVYVIAPLAMIYLGGRIGHLNRGNTFWRNAADLAVLLAMYYSLVLWVHV